MLDYMLEVKKIPAERIELKHLTRDCTTVLRLATD